MTTERQLHDALLTLDELLNAISGVLDIRGIFDRVSAIARKVLPHDAKEVAARVVHRGSSRANGPFVAPRVKLRPEQPLLQLENVKIQLGLND